MQVLYITLSTIGMLFLFKAWCQSHINSGTNSMMYSFFLEELEFIKKHGMNGEGSHGVAPSAPDMPAEFIEWAKTSKVNYENVWISAWDALQRADDRFNRIVQQINLPKLSEDDGREETAMGKVYFISKSL